MNRVRTHGCEGFTLIEVLVALTILSVSLAALLAVFSNSLDRTRRSEREMVAASLTQSLLSEAGVALPLTIGDTGGTFANGMHWRLHVEPYGTPEDRDAWPVGAVIVSASTLWDDD